MRPRQNLEKAVGEGGQDWGARLLGEFQERRRGELRAAADAAEGTFLARDRGGRPDVSEGVALALKRAPGLGGLESWARGLEERLLGGGGWEQRDAKERAGEGAGAGGGALPG